MHILAFVLGAEARAWEALPLVRILVEQHRYGPPQLLLTGATDQFYINHRQFVEQSLTTLPEDPLPRLALARTALINEDLLTAEAELKRVLARDPVPIEAHARWGRLLFDQQRLSELRAWQQALPVEADAHPEIWITRGLYALQQRQESAAIRCFGTAALLDPNHLTAHLYLGRLLPGAGQPELAREFQQRAELLSELLTPLTTFRNNVDPLLVRRVADLCERLGRPRESLAWAEWMLRTNAEAGWAAELVTRFHQQFPEGPVWILDESRLARRLELETLPLPDWKPSHTESNSEDRLEQGLTRLQWTNEAAALGIHFQYHNDAASTENTLRMPEFTGGGLAVLDFDVDGWPDLYAAQGASLSTASRAPVLLDRLFRQQAEGRFIDATGSSGIRETGYSQGVTVGDFDQDGFPDLYVANFGPNRLYRNNGDGTFTDVTETAGLNDRDWTTSCVMADLNNDGWPEIVAVNYLTGADIATRVCGTASHPKACLPTQFEPQQDRVWVNLGNGRFAEQTGGGLVEERDAGRGLGVVIAALDDPGRPALFIANDTDPNFWYVNESAPGGPLRWREEGLYSGLALDSEGHAQACMGIATGDVDRDGLLDIFVTNFYRESNVLYRQQAAGTFQDETRASGLRDPSLLMLGFGAQFLDADADGWLDLLVTNGHVYNNEHLGEPWRMRPQVFRNSGAGRFQEAPASETGEYFAGTYLGRALVRWDWNRDGLPDVAVSHLDAPLAVLTNRTSTPHHTLVLSLTGTASNREAIGAIVNLKAGNDQWQATITAGDGYLASNERRLCIGLGRVEKLDMVEVRWPSGRVQSFADVSVDQEWLAVEGRSLHSLRPLQRTTPRSNNP